jgi:hypothetical protein
MAEDFIDEIYRVSDLAFDLKKLAYRRRQNHTVTIVNIVPKILDALFELSENPEMENGLAQELRNEYRILRETVFQNPCYSANFIEDNLIPTLTKLVDEMGRIDVSEGKFRLISSKSGYLTLQCTTNGRFCHDIDNPMYEAWLQAIDLVDTNCFEYHILGCGLGYLPYQIWSEMEKSAKIVIYEVGQECLNYALSYGVLGRIDEKDLEIRIFDSMEELMDSFMDTRAEGKERKFCVSPWMSLLYPTEYDQTIDTLLTNELGIRDNEKLWRINANKNLKKTSLNDNDLKSKFHNDEWIVVAAGPSLIDNLDFLRESKGKRTIVCVNTSLRKLAREGIEPDLVTAVDPLPILATHLDGVEEATVKIPLLAEVCTSWSYVERYRGPVYLCTKYDMLQYMRPETVREDGEAWIAGCTVTNLALEACFRFGAKKIYLVGVDLAYPGNKTHADGVAHPVKSVEGDRTTRSNSGGEVPTAATFNLFREDTEMLLRIYKGIPVVNLSKEGAYIEGTFTGGWWEKTVDLQTAAQYADYLKHLVEDPTLLWKEKYYLLWQTLYRLKEKNLAEEEEVRAALSALFEAVYAEFAKEIHVEWGNRPIGIPKLSYCFTAYHGMGPELQDRGSLADTLAKVPNGKQVLVVNTAEAFGGVRRAVEQEVFREYPENLLGKEQIRVGKREYPYYQFADYPGDVRFAEEFFQFVNANPPAEIYTDTDYSLVAEYVRRKLR